MTNRTNQQKTTNAYHPSQTAQQANHRQGQGANHGSHTNNYLTTPAHRPAQQDYTAMKTRDNVSEYN